MATTIVETFQLKAGKPVIDKDPNAEKDYTIDFSEWLALSSDTIASVTVLVAGVTLVASTFNGTEVTVWVSGGTPNQTGSATVRITTAGVGARPRIDDRTIYFKIKEQ